MSFKAFVSCLNEAANKSLSRIHQHTQNRTIGMVTSDRAGMKPAELESRRKTLEAAIREAGYGYINVKGRYIEGFGTKDAKPVDEHSFLIVGEEGRDQNEELKTFLTSLGMRFGQDSVLYKPYDSESATLIGTNKGGYPGLGVESDIGKWHPNKMSEFQTALRGNRTFMFSSDGESTKPTDGSKDSGSGGGNWEGQPRAPAGTSNGGQWVKEEYDMSNARPLTPAMKNLLRIFRDVPKKKRIAGTETIPMSVLDSYDGRAIQGLVDRGLITFNDWGFKVDREYPLKEDA